MEWQVTETGGVTDAEFRHALTTGAKATALTLGAYGPPQAEAHAANAFEPVTFRHADAWRGPAAEQARSNVHAQASNVNALAELDHERRGDRNESLGVHAQARKGTEQGRAHLQEQLVAAAPRMNAAETKLAALRHQGDALEADHKRTTDLRGHHKGKAKRTRKRTGRWRGLGKKHAHNAAALLRGSKNPAALAKRLEGRWASDLKRSGIGMDRGVPNGVCCANFVSAMLRHAGLIDFHDNRVVGLRDKLLAMGWRWTNHPPVGAVAFPGGSFGHVELYAGGGRLIGSNNTAGGSGPQMVSIGNPYGHTSYLAPPA